MSTLNTEIARINFLSLFESHLRRIKSVVTKEEILKKWGEKQCIFTGLLSYFKGDTVFRCQRQYLTQHKDRQLLRSMLVIIDQMFKEGR